MPLCSFRAGCCVRRSQFLTLSRYRAVWRLSRPSRSSFFTEPRQRRLAAHAPKVPDADIREGQARAAESCEHAWALGPAAGRLRCARGAMCSRGAPLSRLPPGPPEASFEEILRDTLCSDALHPILRRLWTQQPRSLAHPRSRASFPLLLCDPLKSDANHGRRYRAPHLRCFREGTP